MTTLPDDLPSAFASPRTAHRPMLRWWWPGGAVDTGDLCAQLRAFAQAGWGGVEIQPFRVGLPHALPPATADAVHEVFTPQGFATVAAVMAEAEALGMRVDVTFGSCWPFGGGEAITPELAASEVTLGWTTLHGPARWQGTPPVPARPLRSATWLAQAGMLDPAQALPDGWPARIAARARTVAVLAVRGGVPSTGPFAGFVPMTLPDRWGTVLAPGWIDARATVDLTDRLQADGTLDWDVPEGEWQLVVLRRVVSDQFITEGAGRGPQLVMDHLSRAAFDAHAARVGDAALPHWQHHAGTTWRSVFIDSLELQADLHWSDDFEAEFTRRRGYTLRPHLPLLLQPGWRNCFQARLGAPLFDDPQTGPRVRADYRLTVSELMVERLYAPLAAWAQRHGVQAKVQAHGAPADWLQAYGVAGIPETEDLAGGAAPHFLRVARSAAHVYGRPVVSAESFCWLVEGLAVTLQKVRERADELYVNGVQQIVGHGASARLHSEGQARHWYPFEPLEFGTPLDESNPLWAAVPPLTDYLARCQTLLGRGRAVVPVAVLAPLDLFAFSGAGDRMTAPPWHGALQDAGHDWDWLNADGLLHSRLDHGDRCLVTPGGHRYRALVLPNLPALRAEVAERIAEAAAAGLPVIAIDAVPQREEGWLDAEARDHRVQAAMAAVRVVAPSQVGQALRAAGLAPVVSLPDGHGLQFVLREDGPQRWLMLRNPHGESRRTTLRLADDATADTAEQWDAWSGTRTTLPVSADGSVALTLPARCAVLLRLAARTLRTDTLGGPWQVRARGHGLGRRVIALDETWAALTDLSRRPDVADFAGRIDYTILVELAPQDLAAGGVPLRWRLDLGTVHDAALVRVNDAPAEVRSEGPFCFDITRALRPGVNTLCITVVNRPENARRDPAHPGGLPLPGRRLQRLPTGLLGPVRLLAGAGTAS